MLMLNTLFLIKTNEYVLDNKIKQNETLYDSSLKHVI